MRGPHVGEALGLGLDHGAEVILAVGTLLLQVGADGGEILLVDCLRKHGAVRVAACVVGGAQGVLGRVKRQQGVIKKGVRDNFRGRQNAKKVSGTISDIGSRVVLIA